MTRTRIGSHRGFGRGTATGAIGSLPLMDTDIDRTVEERLAILEAASDARRAELRGVLDDLPAALSRRALASAVIRDLRSAPRKREVVTRVVRKLARAPQALLDRARRRLRSSR